MSKISWSEFIIVWLTICVVIDIVLSYFNNKGTKEGLKAEERKAKIKLLNVPYRDDVAYETQIRRASMRKVEVLLPVDDMLLDKTLPEESKVDNGYDVNEDDEKVELTELQQETSDIVKMLFG